jgi:hypothetical protein
MQQDEGCDNWQHNKLWFPLYEIMLQTGTIVTEATYRFDIVKSNHESPFKDLYVSNTAIHYIQHLLATIPLTVFGSNSDPSLWRTFIIYLHIKVLS